MKFTLKQLQYFAAVGETGSVTRAAEVAHVSQASISAAISHLEAIFGVQLFIRRHAQGLYLTPTGRRMLSQVNLLLKQANGLGQYAADLGQSLSGSVEVGCFLTLAPVIMPALIRDFTRAHPAVRIDCHEGDYDELIEGLRQGRIEMAFVYDLSRDADIEFLPLAELPPYAIVASDHPLAGERVVSLRRLAGEPMVLLDLPHSREYFSAIFHGLGLEPAIAYRTASPNMVRAMVANGLGYSLLNVRPRVDRALDGKPYVAVELKEKVRPLQMGIASVADVRFTRISTAFADFCRTTSRLRTFPCMPAPVPVSEGDTTRPTAPSAKPRPS
jgi:DNA-binding transcriptional LysR family regulator